MPASYCNRAPPSIHWIVRSEIMLICSTHMYLWHLFFFLHTNNWLRKLRRAFLTIPLYNFYQSKWVSEAFLYISNCWYRNFTTFRAIPYQKQTSDNQLVVRSLRNTGLGYQIMASTRWLMWVFGSQNGFPCPILYTILSFNLHSQKVRFYTKLQHAQKALLT